MAARAAEKCISGTLLLRPTMLLAGLALAAAALSGCTSSALDLPKTASVTPTPRPDTGKGDRLTGMIDAYAAAYDVPRELVHRVVKRESNYNPTAYSSGNWGLMQIRHGTAKNMGYDGPAKGLLDAETNLKYAVKYLRGAYLVAGGNHDRAVRLYASGYYYDAKRKGLLEETGLRGDAVQVASLPEANVAQDTVSPADSNAKAGGGTDVATASTEKTDRLQAERGQVAANAAAPAEDVASARVATAVEASGGVPDQPGQAQMAAQSAPMGEAAPAAAMSFAGGTPTAPAGFVPVPMPAPR